MKRLIREPFFHFLLLGALIFVAYRVSGPSEEQEEVIVIDDSDLDRITGTWQLQWQRPPTAEELDGLIEQYIRQEVYYREALEMRLDHNDEIVKRRLYQKLEFLMDDMSELAEPSEEQLQAYYTEHQEDYEASDLLSYTGIYFNPDIRTDAMDDAAAVLDQLPDSIGRDFDHQAYGDASMLESSYWNISEESLVRYMGSQFTDTVFQLSPGKWYGPIRSGYGWHLVFIHDRTPVGSPDWEVVRNRVLTDYMYERRNTYSEAVYEELRKQYRIVYDVRDDRLKSSAE